VTQEELDKYSQYIDRDRLEYIAHQRQLFDEAKPMLLENYLNEYVAFENGQVLDHDVDEEKLAERIYRKYGDRDLLTKQVTIEERVYYIGGSAQFRTQFDDAVSLWSNTTAKDQGRCLRGSSDWLPGSNDHWTRYFESVLCEV
jgi:hypothetical protein